MVTVDRALEYEAELDRVADLESARGYLHFLRHVVVDAQPERRPFREIGEWWQWDREERRAPFLEQLAGLNPSYSGVRRFWGGYAKGHSKTTDAAWRVLWLLGYAKTNLNIYVCAGDKDQAGLLALAMKTGLERNPWLAERVKVSGYHGQGLENNATVTIMPQEAWSGQGIFPDYIIADEITHWLHDSGKQFWDFVVASAAKRPWCVLEVLTNAGFKGSWQWEVRKVVKDSSYWDFFEMEPGKRLASWMDEKQIAEDSKLMSKGEVRRLLNNEWIDPGEEDGYLTLADAEGCEVDREERFKGVDTNQYFAVVDYGGVIDRCSLCVLHAIPGTDRVEVDRLDCWQGTHDNRVQLLRPEPGTPYERSVEEWMDITLSNFRRCVIVFDPAQCEALAQKYERRGRRVERFEFKAGKKNYRMAQLLRTMVQSRRVSWSRRAGYLAGVEDDTFAKELAMLVLKPMSYGYKFDHESGRFSDRACAVAMGLTFCVPETPPDGPHVTAVEPEPEKPGQYKTPSPREAVPQKSMDSVRRWGIMGIR